MKLFHFIVLAPLFAINTIYAMQDNSMVTTESSSYDTVAMEPPLPLSRSCLFCDSDYDSPDTFNKHLSSQCHMIKVVLIYKNTLRPITSIPLLPQKKEILSVIKKSQHVQHKEKRGTKWCAQCNKSLVGSLKLHIRAIHNNETPYHCSACSHPTSQRANCQRHIRNEHFANEQNAHIIIKFPGKEDAIEEVSKQYYQCIRCNLDFHEIAAFARHKKKHPQEKETEALKL